MNKWLSSPRRPALVGKRVMVVEDEALVGMLITEELSETGAAVLGPAASVAEALLLVDSAMADGGLSAAVLDLNLAGEHIWPVADLLRRHGVPFLFATGYPVRGSVGVPVLFKPFDPRHLVAAIEALVISAEADLPSRPPPGWTRQGDSACA